MLFLITGPAVMTAPLKPGPAAWINPIYIMRP